MSKAKRVYKSTMVELVVELRKLPRCEGVDLMIQEALAGEYHDYKNKKYDCGKVEASARLHKLGHPILARRIECGEFDEAADADDIAMMRAEIDKMASSPAEAEALRKTLGL